ncbi:hypothetical protein [Halobaculum sp. EA56]|uniref:hypothetical protein n=1 Tax=Halobaculum sp. EA56 TaxID=3421648 RepID=UPI003EBBFBC7
MSLLAALAESVETILSAVDDALDQLEEEKAVVEQNTPPITPVAKAIETWPTEPQHDRDPVQQPFQGHPKPLGGDL